MCRFNSLVILLIDRKIIKMMDSCCKPKGVGKFDVQDTQNALDYILGTLTEIMLGFKVAIFGGD